MTWRTPHGSSGRTAVWVSTSLETKGGVSSYVRGMSETPLWDEWNIKHVATHCDGSAPAKMFQFLCSLPRFVFLIVNERPAVVHLHVASRGSFYRKFTMAMIARVARVAVVAHVHGGHFDVFYANSPRPVKRAIRSLLAHSGVVIALGDSWSQRLTAIEPSADVIVMPNPARPGEAVAQPAGRDPVEVLFVGRLEDAKGVWDLLAAWHDMQQRIDRPARLTLVGEGDLERARLTIRDLGVAETVTVTGWLDPAEVQVLLRHSHVLVLPSFIEGQPMSILEAMANGLCVIASSVGGIPDLLGDSAGVLLQAGDVPALTSALASVVSDDQLRATLGAAALDRIREDFDIDVVWRRFDRIYREVSR